MALSKHISIGKYNIATVIKWGIWSYLPIFKQPTNQFIHELYHCMSALYPIIFSWWNSHFHWDASHFFSHHLHIFHLGPPQDPWDPDLLILGRMPTPPEGHRESLTRDSRLDMRWILKQKNIGSIGSIGSIESLVLCQSRVWPVSSCSQCAVEELKDQLREPLGLAADTPLALSYQNGPSPEKPSLDTSLDPQRMVSNPWV